MGPLEDVRNAHRGVAVHPLDRPPVAARNMNFIRRLLCSHEWKEVDEETLPHFSSRYTYECEKCGKQKEEVTGLMKRFV